MVGGITDSVENSCAVATAPKMRVANNASSALSLDLMTTASVVLLRFETVSQRTGHRVVIPNEVRDLRFLGFASE
jgi:hypothetical protein